MIRAECDTTQLFMHLSSRGNVGGGNVGAGGNVGGGTVGGGTVSGGNDVVPLILPSHSEPYSFYI